MIKQAQQIAKIIPLIKLPRHLPGLFDYKIPNKIQIKPGQLVEVDFRNRKMIGIVSALQPYSLTALQPYSLTALQPHSLTALQPYSLTASQPKNLKPILNVLSGLPVLSQQLKLIHWFAEFYFVSLASSAEMFIPEIPKREIKTKLNLQKYSFSKNYHSLTIKKNQIPQIKNLISQFVLRPVRRSFSEGGFHNFTISQFINQPFNLTLITYIKLIEHQLKKNKQTILIAPTARELKIILSFMPKKFKDLIAVFESKIHQKKNLYYNLWLKVLKNQAKIIIGARSAIFAPAQNLGLIIMHNADSDDLKQYDQNPRYDARRVAKKIQELTKCQMILNSQTALQPDSFTARQLYSQTAYTVINLIYELQKKNYTLISDELEQRIQASLNKKQKIILFYNRRGYARRLICPDCNFLWKCAECGLPMSLRGGAAASLLRRSSYFGCEGWTTKQSRLNPQKQSDRVNQAGIDSSGNDKTESLSCSHCQKQFPAPVKCPKCNNTRLKTQGYGEEKVKQDLQKIFPGTKIATIPQAKNLLSFYTDLFNKKFEIILSTEPPLIDKLKISNKIELVALLSADTNLYLPDFRSAEKTYLMVEKAKEFAQTIQEASALNLIIQSYNPEHYAIKYSLANNPKDFWKQEFESRQKLNYPPYSQLIKLIYQAKTEKQCQIETKKIYQKLNALSLMPNAQPTPPQPCFVKKVRSNFRWQIVMKVQSSKFPPALKLRRAGKIQSDLEKILRRLPPAWLIDREPVSLL